MGWISRHCLEGNPKLSLKLPKLFESWKVSSSFKCSFFALKVYFVPSGSTPSWTLVVRSSTTSTWCGAPTPIHWHPNSRPFVMSKSLEKVLFLDVFGDAFFLPLSKSVVWSNNESDHVWSVFYSQVGTLAQDCDSKLPFMSVHCVPGFGGRIIHNHTQT